jgi:hypothetical protein
MDPGSARISSGQGKILDGLMLGMIWNYLRFFSGTVGGGRICNGRVVAVSLEGRYIDFSLEEEEGTTHW